MLMLLQCAMEENCLSSSAYTIDRHHYGIDSIDINYIIISYNGIVV